MGEVKALKDLQRRDAKIIYLIYNIAESIINVLKDSADKININIRDKVMMVYNFNDRHLTLKGKSEEEKNIEKRKKYQQKVTPKYLVGISTLIFYEIDHFY